MSAARLPWRCIALLAGALYADGALAKKVYKTVDANGVTHFSDRKPEHGVAAQVLQVRAEKQPIATLRLEGLERERRAVVSNRLAGAVEVELRLSTSANIDGSPPLPLRVVLPAESERVLATLHSQDPTQASSFSIAFTAVPGDPNALPDDSVYRLPLDTSEVRIDQGFGGGFSHRDAQSHYAIDFAAPEGTPVLAARAGVVMQVEDDFEGAGLDLEKFGGRANHIRIQHDDGTMAVYAHLQPESVTVAPGARVRTGQRIGASGNTGFSTGPHLHFALQVNLGLRLASIPFLLEGPDGPIEIPGSDALHERLGESGIGR
jgi:murein DD-endopeptidase MepM/ murein hydrolase activator NlpD